MLNHALMYLRHGWNIIPLQEKSKKPALSSWSEYKNRRVTEDEVRRWFGSGKNNIAVLTGAISNLVVVDSDGPDGSKTLSEMRLRSSVMAISGKGYHLFFSHPGREVENLVRLRPGVDLRGDGGYILVSPSVHPSGRIYTWLSDWTQPLPKFPISLLGERPVAERNSDGWVAKAISEMQPGNRHHTLTRIIGKMVYDGWSEQDIISVLAPTLDKFNSEGVNTDAFEDARGIIKDLRRKEETKSFGHRGVTGIPGPDGPLSPEFGVDDLMAHEHSVEWIVDGLIPKQGATIVGGQPDVGKSWLLMDLALSLASGGRWLGAFPVEKRRVLYLDEENGLVLLKERIGRLTKGCERPGKDTLRFKVGSGVNFSNPVWVEQMKTLLRESPVDVVIIDSLIRSHKGDENSSTELAKIFAQVKSLMDQYGVAFIFADHESKGAVFSDEAQTREPSARDLRGSIEKAAFCDSVILARKLGDQVVVHHVKGRWRQKMKPFCVTIVDTPEGATEVRRV